VTFDPFGDFETRGYLRNLAKEKDPDIVRRLEHASFMTGIDIALERLAKVKRLSRSYFTLAGMAGFLNFMKIKSKERQNVTGWKQIPPCKFSI
jgi:hypothetical protein